MHTRQSSGFRRLSTTPLAALAGCAVLAAAVLVASATSTGAGVQPDLVAMAATEPVDQVTQLSEQDSAVGRTSISDAAGLARSSAQTVCDQGAKWLRLRFTELSLRGGDTVTLTGTSGEMFTFTGKHWPGKAFHTRAFAGECVRVAPHLADPGSRFTIDAYQSGIQELAAATVTVAAVGDVCGTSCNQTAPLVSAMNPQALILAGDNAYENGSLAEYNSLYDPYYGQFKSITYPSPGNHEYQTSGATGYFDYFGARAGVRGQGYYSFDVGDWHFVALNSNIARTAGSAQEQWLRNDLAANTKPCTAAFWHHPRFSRGSHGDDTSVRPLYQALYDARADLLVVGHDHNYQRFAPSRPDGTRDDTNGLRQLLIGTGGRGFYNFDSTPAAVVEASNANTFGVGKLTLSATGYTAQFVPVAGRTYTDQVSGTCHKATATPDFGIAATPAAVTVAQGASATSSIRVSSLNGFSAATNLSVSGLPTGVTAALSPNPVTPASGGSATSTLTLTAASSASATTANITVTGTSGALTRSTAVQVTVSPPTPVGCSGSSATDVSIPDSGTAESAITISGCTGNASATSSVAVNIVHTYIGDLVVSLVAPDGTAYILHNRTGGGTDNINQTYPVNLSSEVANGTWRLRAQDAAAQDTGYLNSWTLNLGGGTAQPDFTLAASPAAVSIARGASGTSTASVTSTNGFASAVTLSVSGAPAGMTASWQSNPVTPPSGGSVSSQLTIATTAATATGTFPLTVTGTSGSLTRSAPVQVTVTAPGTGGFSDDFEANSGWVVNPSGTDTATTGLWERGDPDETIATNVNQVKQLGTTPSGVSCLSTGRLAGSSYGANDVDGGITSIRSPLITVPAGTATLSFRYNVAHGNNSSTADYFRVKVIDGSTVSTVFQVLGAASAERNGAWIAQSVNLSAYAGKTVYLLIETADVDTGSLWEAQVDDLAVA